MGEKRTASWGVRTMLCVRSRSTSWSSTSLSERLVTDSPRLFVCLDSSPARSPWRTRLATPCVPSASVVTRRSPLTSPSRRACPGAYRSRPQDYRLRDQPASFQRDRQLRYGFLRCLVPPWVPCQPQEALPRKDWRATQNHQGRGHRVGANQVPGRDPQVNSPPLYFS